MIILQIDYTKVLKPSLKEMVHGSSFFFWVGGRGGGEKGPGAKNTWQIIFYRLP